MPRIKVLIVEDNPLAAEINLEFLKEDPDFVCIGTAFTGEEALRFIQESPPDLVLLDNFLPDYNGTALIEKVRKFNKTVDFIMITAAKEVPVVQESFRLGIRDYLVKPYLKSRFLQALTDYKRFFHALGQEEICTQHDVDSLARPGTRSETDSLPKGINPLTQEKILAFLSATDDAVTAEEVAKGVGISSVAARRYLNYLVEEGIVRADLEYGQPGRPRFLYRLYLYDVPETR
ncbi:MAG: response regulator [Firmicutes bacterium]|nr:response regulator [Bacillota bacterium]